MLRGYRVQSYSGFGRDIEKRRTSFKELAKLVDQLGEPTPRSAKQEMLENRLADYVNG